MFEQLEANHQPNRLTMTAQSAVIRAQALMELIPIDELSHPGQFMVGIYKIRKIQFKHL